MINLNALWNTLAIAELSFLSFIKIIFLILFVLLNLGLIYSEYQNNRNIKTSNFVLSGGLTNELKTIGGVILASISFYASGLTIYNEYKDKKHMEDLKSAVEKSKNELIKIGNDYSDMATTHRKHLNTVAASLKRFNKIDEEHAKVNAEVANDMTKSKGVLPANLKARKDAIDQQHSEALKNLNGDVSQAKTYTDGIMKEKNIDKNKTIEKILKDKDDVDKSLVFNLDELLTNFDSLNGIGKLAFTMMLSSSLILWCLFNIILNIYGNYLLDRFKLETKYPRIAKLIEYRRKLTKYYLISNFLIITIMCLNSIGLGIFIFSL